VLLIAFCHLYLQEENQMPTQETWWIIEDASSKVPNAMQQEHLTFFERAPGSRQHLKYNSVDFTLSCN
jgi:hypothetical protein